MERVWRIPTPPPGNFNATDGAGVLAENLHSLGVLLWDLARDVALWSATHLSEATELFAPREERLRLVDAITVPIDRSLESAISILARMVGDPRAADRPRVSLACRRISSAAETEGALATALVFAMAAGHATPGDPNVAYQIGRLARRNAEYERAKLWLSRAVLLGKQIKDWHSYGLGLSGLGNLAVQRGDYPTARKYHFRTLRVAQRHRLRKLEGDALHDLCGIAIEVGPLEEVTHYARLAYEAYGPGHQRLPALAHDVAYAWMEAGYFAQAIEIFEVVLPHPTKPQERVQVAADIARAAAGTGNSVRFEQSWERAWIFMSRLTTKDHTPQALLDLARGAALLQQWDRAEMTVQMALALATERREGRIRITAETVLESVTREKSVKTRPIIGPTPKSAEPSEEQLRLTADFVTSLRE
jgi:tetratricopeptide (TPR) repeat protein